MDSLALRQRIRACGRLLEQLDDVRKCATSYISMSVCADEDGTPCTAKLTNPWSVPEDGKNHFRVVDASGQVMLASNDLETFMNDLANNFSIDYMEIHAFKPESLDYHVIHKETLHWPEYQWPKQ